ncbi:hypothetical protein CONLIGDRAFT_627768 [Coniochaeta ligniaria NRRL 30616]|uniref:Kinesin light chain n=1 Tax=Coniochaeta ligniaria NRRL 30616 TaxID=1408157 RepID=A0A1J7JS54_9PEZI|nr:hypothetical protein CONLIGDRAFT_627768 [Coniochaeta ligniaria NRRL 30616]
MEATKRVLGEEHPHTLNSMAHLAATYRSQLEPRFPPTLLARLRCPSRGLDWSHRAPPIVNRALAEV